MRNPARLSRLSPVSALAFTALLAACEQPVRPANGPTPRQVMVSEVLNVPVSTIQAVDRGRVRIPAAADSRADPSSTQAQRLREELELLARAQSAGGDATP